MRTLIIGIKMEIDPTTLKVDHEIVVDASDMHGFSKEAIVGLAEGGLRNAIAEVEGFEVPK